MLYLLQMLKISTAVKQILYKSEVALTAMQEGYLNYSAYAGSIQKEVESLCMKPVQVGSITVALTRLKEEIAASKELLPQITLKTFSATTDLVEIALEKTRKNQQVLQSIYSEEKFSDAEFLCVTHGISEFSLLFPSRLEKDILSFLNDTRIKFHKRGLASITVAFDEKVIVTPNVMFAVLRPLALNSINIVELVSTYTEMSIIVAQEDVNKAFQILGKEFWSR
jgi:aspartokinase